MLPAGPRRAGAAGAGGGRGGGQHASGRPGCGM